MKIKYLIEFTIKKIIRNFDLNFSLLIVLIIGICGLMITSEFSNIIKKDNNIMITIKVEDSSINSNEIENLIEEIRNFDNILEIKFEDNLYIKTNKNKNIYKIKKLLYEYKYEFPVEINNCDDLCMPKFAGIIKKISNCLFILLFIVIQIIFIIITLKKMNLESEDYALLKCIGYRTKDIALIIIIQLIFITILAFICSVVISFFAINIFTYFLQKFIDVNISLQLVTVIKQIVILIMEYFILCIFMVFRIKKINCIGIK